MQKRSLRFNYGFAEPTIATVIAQAIGYGSVCWSEVEKAGEFESEAAGQAAEAAVAEVRNILHTRLTKLLDATGTAREWNDAIEAALRVVEKS